MKSILMNDMHQRSYLLSFEISWLIGFYNQWALLYLSVIFQYFSEWGFNMWFKIFWNTFFCKIILCCFSVSDTSPYIVCHETKESEILCLPVCSRQIIGVVLSFLAFELNSPICCAENTLFFLNALSEIRIFFLIQISSQVILEVWNELVGTGLGKGPGKVSIG